MPGVKTDNAGGAAAGRDSRRACHLEIALGIIIDECGAGFAQLRQRPVQPCR
jgi:hypothetical protein